MDGKWKWIIAGLGFSLLLNVFLAGTFIGSQIGKPKASFRGPPIDFNINKLGEYLTADERQEVRKLMKARRKELNIGYKALKNTERTIRTLIMAKEVDLEALEVVLREHGKHVQNMHAPMQNVLLKMVAKLDYETRQKLGADMFKRRDRGEHRGKRRPPPHPSEHFREGDGRPYPPPEGRRHPPREEYLEKHSEPDPNL